MKSLWIKLILVATFAASGNSLSFAQTPENLYQKGDERIEKKGDVETSQLQKTNFPENKNEFTIARERLNWSTRKQLQLDRIETALSRGPSRNNAFLGKEDSTTYQIIQDETLMVIQKPQPIFHSVLQFLKKTGKSLITFGILTILFIYILLMLIVHLRVSYTKKKGWKFIL